MSDKISNTIQDIAIKHGVVLSKDGKHSVNPVIDSACHFSHRQNIIKKLGHDEKNRVKQWNE